MSVGTEYPIKKALLGVIILHTRCACDYYREMAPNCTLLCGLNCCPLFGASVFFFFFLVFVFHFHVVYQEQFLEMR